MQLRRWSTSVILPLPNQYISRICIRLYNIGYSRGVILPTVKENSLHKRKSPELWLVRNPELRVEVNLNKKSRLRITHF
jgi:hypothetical protein